MSYRHDCFVDLRGTTPEMPSSHDPKRHAKSINVWCRIRYCILSRAIRADVVLYRVSIMSTKDGHRWHSQ